MSQPGSFRLEDPRKHRHNKLLINLISHHQVCGLRLDSSFGFGIDLGSNLVLDT